MDTTASDSSSSFIVIYEIVLGIMLSSSSCITDNSTSNNNDSSTNTIDIEWSPDGTIVAIGSGDAVIVISTNPCRYLNNNAYKNSKFSLVKIIRGMRNVESISFRLVFCLTETKLLICIYVFVSLILFFICFITVLVQISWS